MPDAIASSGSKRSPAQQGLWVAAIYSVLLLLVFHQTAGSMVSTWVRSETYAHGFLILPISLWLVWDKRESLLRLRPQPTVVVTLLALPLGFGWLVAWLVDVLVIQQLALVGIMIVGIWAVLGHEMTRVLAFPLAFLIFAVPMGEAFISPMMEFTATSTVWLIQQTGIPVFREGMYFMLPSGNWSVVEACSGVRYLIASVTLGVLYAHLTFRSRWRWGLFVLASIIVPVLANTVRAYIIVMLGHVSDMTVAVGVDHLIYGWVFFGIVMLLLFWVGSIFREDGVGAHLAPEDVSVDPAEKPRSSGSLWFISFVALLLAAIWPFLSTVMDRAPATFIDEQLDMASIRGGWQPVQDSQWTWAPSASVSGLTSLQYHNGSSTVGISLQYPSTADDPGEVVGSISRFVEYRSAPKIIAQTGALLQFTWGNLSIVEAIIRSGGEQYIAWSWYRIGNRNFSNDYLAKLQQGLSSFGLSPGGSYRIVLVTKVAPDDEETGRRTLQRFLEENLSEVERSIDKAGSGD